MGLLCGVDIVEIDRIEKSLQSLGAAFLNRVYTNDEIAYCESKKVVRFKSYAARFAAKEAVSKAFGTGMSNGITFKDIEVLNDELGKPVVNLHGRAKEMFSELKGKYMSISLSHSDNYAVAYAVIQTTD